MRFQWFSLSEQECPLQRVFSRFEHIQQFPGCRTMITSDRNWVTKTGVAGLFMTHSLPKNDCLEDDCPTSTHHRVFSKPQYGPTPYNHYQVMTSFRSCVTKISVTWSFMVQPAQERLSTPILSRVFNTLNSLWVYSTTFPHLTTTTVMTV